MSIFHTKGLILWRLSARAENFNLVKRVEKKLCKPVLINSSHVENFRLTILRYWNEKKISAKLSFTNKFGAATRTNLKSSFTEKEQCTLILTILALQLNKIFWIFDSFEYILWNSLFYHPIFIMFDIFTILFFQQLRFFRNTLT